MMDGFFQEGDKLKAVIGPGEQYVCERVGREGVTRIVVDKAIGPMGYYAVALVYKGDDIARAVPLHMMEVIDIS